jgi:hypothetical protein
MVAVGIRRAGKSLVTVQSGKTASIGTISDWRIAPNRFFSNCS